LDIGFTIAVEVQATTGTVSVSATSAPTAAVTPPPPVRPVDINPPSISGSPVVGETLTEIPGTWTGDPTSYLYAWFECDPVLDLCVQIDAFGPTYTLTAADEGLVIVVGELAGNAAGYGDPAF